ncbi:MAG: zinc-dependent alcohol dehydrogenase family protein [Nitrososphaerota archaeon]|nr:zinc-dependent alcohol dehydrogenase family protein [Nitrososphaerota archaeon]MDG6922185.1 zinc-dependent alcohol dehydrogenase family protein [Nitrososphaerota archaeon]
MNAMVLHKTAEVEEKPLEYEQVEKPEPGECEVLVRVDKCGVCRTDLHVVEGDILPKLSSVIPGHEIVGRIERTGSKVSTLSDGDVVGIPWLHHTCGICEYCMTSRENLCDNKWYTGYSVNGGYSEYAIGREGYAFPLPDIDPARAAPFLCAGIIGYRAFKLALPRPGGRIGFFGFGGSAHLTLQLAEKLGYETVAYSRSTSHLDLAKELGATKTVMTKGAYSSDTPTLDSAIVFAPAGSVVIEALKELKKGGSLSIAAIHMSNIPEIDYDKYLFGERKIMSVEANTRADAREFLDLAIRLNLKSEVEVRPLTEANEALKDLKDGKVSGALVLDCS